MSGTKIRKAEHKCKFLLTGSLGSHRFRGKRWAAKITLISKLTAYRIRNAFQKVRDEDCGKNADRRASAGGGFGPRGSKSRK